MRDRSYASAAAFIGRLFGETSQAVELRAFSNERGPSPRSLFTRDSKEVESFCRREDREGFGVYFGCCTRRMGDGKGDAEHVAECPLLWVDIDCAKQGISGDVALAALEYLPHPPTAIVDSGGGLHAYWLLETPLNVLVTEGGDENPVRDQIIQCLKSLALVLAGDFKCAELARVMRLPGTMNTKDATLTLNNGEPAMCEVLSDTGTVHDFDELVAWLADQRTLLHGKAPEAQPVREDDPFVAYAKQAGYEPAIDIDQALSAMEHGATGDRSIHFTQIRVAYSMIARGYEDDEIVDRLLRATEAAAPRDKKWNWIAEEKAIRKDVEKSRIKQEREKPERAERKKPDNAPPVVSGSNLAVVHDIAEEREKRAKPDDSKGKKDPIVDIGIAVIDQWQKANGPVLHCDGETYAYDAGVWRRWDDALAHRLRVAIQAACAGFGVSPKAQLLNGVKAYFMDRPELVRNDVVFDKGNWRLIIADDGCLDLSSDEPVVVPHSPDHYATFKVGATINGSRDCPTWLSYLAEAFRDESDAEDIIRTLQEWFGAALVSGKTRETTKGLMVYGPSRTGKTQISSVVRALLGEKHIVGLPMRALLGPFGPEPLLGKRGWIADDAIGEGEPLDSETYNKVVTGEPFSVARKNRSSVEASFGFPVLLTSNNLPRVRDQSQAVFNRSLVVRMIRVWPENHPGPVGYKNMAHKIVVEELTGVFWWAVAGWLRLRGRGYFDEPASMKASSQAFQDENQQVGAWLKQCVEKNSLFRVHRADLVASYRGWEAIEEGSDGGLKPQTIMRRIRQQLVGHSESIVNGQRFVAGVMLNVEGLAGWKRHTLSSSNGKVGHADSQNMVNDPFRVEDVEKPVSSGKKPVF